MFAQVILSISHADIDRVFDYAVPENMCGQVKIGMRVRVPFGKGKNLSEGYVVGVSEDSLVPKEKIKYIEELPDEFPVFSEDMLKLAKWMSKRYFATLSKCLQTIIPGGIKDKTDYYVGVKYVRPSDKFKEFIGRYDDDKRKERQAAVIDFINKNGETPLSELKKCISGSEYAIKALKNVGCIEIYTKKTLAKTYSSVLRENSSRVMLNDEQCAVIREWEDEINGARRPILIHGITGSGKNGNIYKNNRKGNFRRETGDITCSGNIADASNDGQIYEQIRRYSCCKPQQNELQRKIQLLEKGAGRRRIYCYRPQIGVVYAVFKPRNYYC